MTYIISKYYKEIAKHRQEIDQLNILKFPTLENLDKRNKILSKIATLNFKLKNLRSNKPELGYGIDIDKTFLTDK